MATEKSDSPEKEEMAGVKVGTETEPRGNMHSTPEDDDEPGEMPPPIEG